MKKTTNTIYLVAGIGIALLAFGVLFFLQNQDSAKAVPDECGDLTDPGNVQHLSHHPQQYSDCIKRVDPRIFLQATGTALNDFMKANNIS